MISRGKNRIVASDHTLAELMSSRKRQWCSYCRNSDHGKHIEFLKPTHGVQVKCKCPHCTKVEPNDDM